MAKLSKDIRAELRLFAFYLGNGTIDNDLLDDAGYLELLEYPSNLEMIFAIWGNVLEIEDEGKVLNASYARHRVAQYIRTWVDPSYVVEPPLADWELELHG